MDARFLARHLSARSGLVKFDEAGTTGNCFIYHMPDAPDEAVMVEVAGGPVRDLAMAYDTFVAHLIVRGTTDPTVSEVKAQALLNYLHGMEGMVYPSRSVNDGIYVVSARALQSRPVPMGRDENGRFEFSINVQFEVMANDSREG